MRRQENQPARPTAGCLSVPLFNQKKRNRVPLTSAPSENEFFSHTEYMASTSSATSHSTSGPYGCYQASGPSSGAPRSHQWNRQVIPQSTQPQQYGSRPAPGLAPTMRACAPIPHPYKVGNTSSKMGQPNNPVRQQDSSSSVNFRQNKYQTPLSSESAQNKQTPLTGFSQMGQQSSYKPPNLTHQYSQQSRSLPHHVPPPSGPSAHTVQPQHHSWKFTNSFGPQNTPFEGKRSTNQPQTPRHTQTQQVTFPMKPAIENSLRILTAVINGMRHWSQFKDKVPCLFEIFATLDSAVTLAHHGAKNFLMRDGKEVVQCIFYENEQELPRLIRGQIHRCVGNYDRSRDVLMCVSVRPGLPSELRNAQEAVKACDAEMRALVKSLSEV
ncbi:spermatogenesis-associated protein 22 isoform X2 [Thunnus albacares]|uniref:spermatogenesis-associated protein 22 isoform X2 n=1 Tax=Thunnus albacares TaxID=8236 RepID=UPI001CF6F3F9|nr:spermatogenesis-associated protein 22 isoform X2 [Thunnus albacares]XP_044226515.1 spermatogenesis-associated protein 22 isoform X2 [Thunnus albacares]